jgi:hypothetical protein
MIKSGGHLRLCCCLRWPRSLIFREAIWAAAVEVLAPVCWTRRTRTLAGRRSVTRVQQVDRYSSPDGQSGGSGVVPSADLSSSPCVSSSRASCSRVAIPPCPPSSVWPGRGLTPSCASEVGAGWLSRSSREEFIPSRVPSDDSAQPDEGRDSAVSILPIRARRPGFTRPDVTATRSPRRGGSATGGDDPLTSVVVPPARIPVVQPSRRPGSGSR